MEIAWRQLQIQSVSRGQDLCLDLAAGHYSSSSPIASPLS